MPTSPKGGRCPFHLGQLRTLIRTFGRPRSSGSGPSHIGCGRHTLLAGEHLWQANPFMCAMSAFLYSHVVRDSTWMRSR
jgi:hypothetical protein